MYSATNSLFLVEEMLVFESSTGHFLRILTEKPDNRELQTLCTTERTSYTRKGSTEVKLKKKNRKFALHLLEL